MTDQQPFSIDVFIDHNDNSEKGIKDSAVQYNSHGIDVNSAFASNKVFFTGTGPTSYELTTSATEKSPTASSNISVNESVTIGVERPTNNSVETECKEGEVRHIDGTCVFPEITRRVFVFSVPKYKQEDPAPPRTIPVPKVEHNVLFVRLPEAGQGPEPVIIPPPRHSNIVYILGKRSKQPQRVIEVTLPPPSEPEVYFVDYTDGENPSLPGGLDLHTALDSANQTDRQIIAYNDVSDSSGLHERNINPIINIS